MDWSLFWNAFGAIGTTVGSLITAIAVAVAVVQYKQPLIKKLKLTVSTSFPVYDNGLGESHLCVSLSNTGIRPIIISNIYLNIEKRNYVINKLMIDFTGQNETVEFPLDISPEQLREIHIPYPLLADAFAKLSIQDRAVSINRKIKVLATDTTSGKHYCNTGLTVRRLLKMRMEEHE